MPVPARPAPKRPGEPPEPSRHVRVELPDRDYQRLSEAAGAVHISIAGYARQAIMERIRQDERYGRAER